MSKELIIWNTPSSGLADVLLDLILYSVLGKINGFKKVHFKLNQFDHYYGYENNGNKINFDHSRISSRSIKNILKHLDLPKNITLFQNNIETKGKQFHSRPPRHFSPITFFEFYNLSFLDIQIDPEVNYDEFKSIYLDTVSELSVKNCKNYFPDLTVHLRRKDKLVDNPDECQSHIDEIDELNNLTMFHVDNFIKKNKNLKIYFASDCLETKKIYEQKYQKYLLEYEIHQDEHPTYFDLNMISNSENILMSGKYTGFSLLGALMNNKKLYHFYKYEECMKRLNYDEFDNIILI